MLLMLLAYCSYLVNCAQFVRRGMQAGRQSRQANLPQQGL